MTMRIDPLPPFVARRTARPSAPVRLRLPALLALLALAPAACEPAATPAPDSNGAASGAPGKPAADAPALPPAPARPAAVLFLGNSITAGYGLDPDDAYPALIQERIDAAGYPFRVVNAGVSGETSAGGLRRVEWLLDQPIAVFVLALGANDMLRGQPPASTRRNLAETLQRVRERQPRARLVLAGMRAAPNLGPAFASEYEAIFPDLARQYDAALVPFLLDGVAAVPRLNLPDGIHPTAQGQHIVADNVWQVLEPLLREHAAAASRSGNSPR
jgi:acyl-CoA thioesterase I